MGDLLQEFYEDLWAEKAGLEQARKEGAKIDVDRLRKVTKMLTGDSKEVGRTGDPLIDKWERDIAEGREIDLDELPETASREVRESHERVARRLASLGVTDG